MKSAAVFCFVFLFVLACGGGGDGGTDQGGKDVPVEVLNDETTDAAEEEILAKETVEETAGETIVETAQEVVHGDSPTGGPCVENKDCFTNFCLTSAVLSQLISKEVIVNNGYCTKIGCGSDSECGEEGKCVEGTAIAGAPLFLCLHPCENNDNCRKDEDMACFEHELLDMKVCLPNSLIQEILSEE